MSQLAAVHATPGVAGYMAEVEAGLDRAVAGRSGIVQEVAGEALAAGGKRLRPLLCFLTGGGQQSVAAGVAVELVHMDRRAVETLADAALALARGEAMQRLQTNDPDTTLEAYVTRCRLKTAKLIEAACLLGSAGAARLGLYGVNLGIAFQIADDILDCAGQTQETGKIPGTDLREGTPTMPLLLAAQEDEVVRLALAGGPVDGALVRVAATHALDRSREEALRYAAEARSHLRGDRYREELEALTFAVVDRAG
jgi:geranylgeranyl pyrophosphate synthase